jgi:hypothetical protein
MCRQEWNDIRITKKQEIMTSPKEIKKYSKTNAK